MSHTKSRLTSKEDKLYLAVRDEILSHSEQFREAGEYLDTHWTFSAIKQREDEQTREIHGLGPNDPLPDFFDEAAALRVSAALGFDQPVGLAGWVTREISAENMAFGCLNKFFIAHTGSEGELKCTTDLSGLPEDEARLYASVILLVAWLLTDPEAHLRGLGLTQLEQCGYGEDEALTRDWSRHTTLLVHEDRSADWMDLVESALAQVQLRFREETQLEDSTESTSAKPNEATESGPCGDPEELVIPYALSPTDEAILNHMEGLNGERATTQQIADATELDTKSIGKNLSNLRKVGLLHNKPRMGYLRTKMPRPAAE